MPPETFDAIVIGAGQAGPALAAVTAGTVIHKLMHDPT